MTTQKFSYRSIVLVFLIAAAGAAYFALQYKKSLQSPLDPAGLQVGRPAPDFTLPGLDGKMLRLSDYRGKVVLVNIWATWCAPCVAEMPSMEKLYGQLGRDVFEILAVSLDEEGAGAVAPFMKKHQLTFPALIDTQGITKIAYGTTGIPESFIINQQGLMVRRIIGPLDWASPEVLKYFRELLRSVTPDGK